MAEQWKSELVTAYQKIGTLWVAVAKSDIINFKGTKDEWMDKNAEYILRSLPHLPEGWATEGQIRAAALKSPANALADCTHLLPTDLLEQCIVKCSPYWGRDIAKGKAELARRQAEEQEFLVKTIQAL